MFGTLRRIAVALETLAAQRVREVDIAAQEGRGLRALNDCVTRLGVEMRKAHASHVEQCLRWQYDIQRALEQQHLLDDDANTGSGQVH